MHRESMMSSASADFLDAPEGEMSGAPKKKYGKVLTCVAYMQVYARP